MRKSGPLSLFKDDLAKVPERITTIAEFRSIGGIGVFVLDPAMSWSTGISRTDTSKRSASVNFPCSSFLQKHHETKSTETREGCRTRFKGV